MKDNDYFVTNIIPEEKEHMQRIAELIGMPIIFKSAANNTLSIVTFESHKEMIGKFFVKCSELSRTIEKDMIESGYITKEELRNFDEPPFLGSENYYFPERAELYTSFIKRKYAE